MVNVQWLRYLQVVANVGSFQAAAAELHVTQQALSKAIASLEAYFGVKLLERGHRVRGLTEAGQSLVNGAAEILHGLQRLEAEMSSFRDPEPHGAVSIGSGGFCHNYLLPPLLVRLKQQFPRVSARLITMRAAETERRVAMGDVDLGIMLSAPEHPGLEALELFATESLIVGVPQPPRPWSEWEYIVPRTYLQEEERPLDGWSDTRYSRRVAAEVDRLETALYLAERGLGVTVAPRLVVQERLDDGTLAILAMPPERIAARLFVVWRSQSRLTSAMRAIIELLGQVGAPPLTAEGGV